MSHDPRTSHRHHHPPHDSSPPYLTYPWQPGPPPPPPAAPPAPAPYRRPLGHHRDLRNLRTAYRRQRRTATFAALGYFLVFLGLAAFAPSSLTGTVTPGLSTGLLLALLQLPVTWLAIALYERTARRRVDPLADRIRAESAGDAHREAGR
ncbi:DUF485 domain-containing protein [Streptomyces fumanus]|uniref:DUF485 domain-containing protein n=1 Tax=Streptomyces fumanus TaxID=67302 RepID=A0A919AG08_9ACTN|nr:DUF485 domain-containing protein [Streptomyces fumanus]GHF04877.1 hypothetical protein GCM10018772_32650 [Streptomyces fumanus]